MGKTLFTTWLFLLSACVVFDESLVSGDGGEPDTDVASDAATDTPSDTPLDTPLDTPTDTPLDTPLDTPTDTPLDTPIDTPPDTPPPSPDCVSYDHDCNGTPHYFYPGTAGQNCTAVCASHGGYATATSNVVGSAGTTNHCRRVLQSMFNTGNEPTTGSFSTGVGCSRLNGSTLKRYTSPNTSETASHATIERVCACTNNNSCEISNDHCS